MIRYRDHAIERMAERGITEEDVMWADPPDNEEAGSPNVVGAVAMAAAARFLSEDLGWDWVVEHERELTSYALEKLNSIPGLKIHGPHDPSLPEDRLGVISLNLDNVNHKLVAAVLSHEYAIGTRTGCFCAHPYLMRLFHVPHERVEELRGEIGAGDRRALPGALRISFGFYNSKSEVDAAIDALRQIQSGKWHGHYTQDVLSGEYEPAETKTNPAGWFNL